MFQLAKIQSGCTIKLDEPMLLIQTSGASCALNLSADSPQTNKNAISPVVPPSQGKESPGVRKEKSSGFIIVKSVACLCSGNIGITLRLGDPDFESEIRRALPVGL